MILNKCTDCGCKIPYPSDYYCLQCQTPLCKRCSFKLLCNTHLGKMSIEMQNKLTKNANSIRILDTFGYLCLYLFCICIALVCIFLILYKYRVITFFVYLSPAVIIFGIGSFIVISALRYPDLFAEQVSLLRTQNITMYFPLSPHKCSICGNQAPTVMAGRVGSFPFQCLVCKKHLCPNHYIEGFCPEHAQLLSQTIRDEFKRLD